MSFRRSNKLLCQGSPRPLPSFGDVAVWGDPAVWLHVSQTFQLDENRAAIIVTLKPCIPNFLQIKTLEYLGGKRTFRDNVSRLISRLESLLEILALLLCGQELDLCNEFHYLHTHTVVTKAERQGKTKLENQLRELLCGSQFLLRLKPGASLEVSQ